MALPTWNGHPVSEGSPEMAEATMQAWEVVRAALGNARLGNESPTDLLHAVEATAWLERLSAVGRHLLVPMAKVSGASWAELGAAMGVTRATAQHRYKQQVEDWEESLRAAAAPPPWEGVEPLAPMDPPIEFEPGDGEFVRMANLPAWEYTGPLEPAIQFVRAHHTKVLVYSDDDVFYVGSNSVEDGVSRSQTTSADTEEKAWRAHLGLVLTGFEQPFPDDARPGETIADFKVRMKRGTR